MLRPVDLQLRDVGQGLVAGVQRAAEPLVEGPSVGLVVCVVEAEHRRRVTRLREALDRPPADPLRGRVGRDEVGVRLLEPGEGPHQLVELGVRDLRIVEDVVALFVIPDALAKISNLLGGGHDSRGARLVSDRGRSRIRAGS